MSDAVSVLTRYQAWIAIGVLIAVAAVANFIGGETLDEGQNLQGLREVLQFGAGVLRGDWNRDFRDITWDLEHYGILPILPAFVALRISQVFGATLPEYMRVYSLALHACALAWSVGTAWCTFGIVKLVSGNRVLSWLTVYALMLFPLWLGFAFFNYKDLLIAFFFSLSIYAALLALDDDQKTFRRALILLSIATVGACGVRIASVALIFPSWLVLLYRAAVASEPRSRILELVVAGLLVVVATFVLTPVSWLEPIGYLIENLSFFSRHIWDGCTLTAQKCLRPAAAGWSAFYYLALWMSAQIPVALLVLTPLAILLTLVSGGTRERLLLALAVIPLVLILARNSTLYDGLRHLLFLMPPWIALVFCAVHRGILALSDAMWRRRATGAAIAVYAATLVVFLIDNITLFPYNYAYRNEITRLIAPSNAYETDFWGFSSDEAVKLAAAKAPQPGGEPRFVRCDARMVRIDAPTSPIERLLVNECPPVLPPDCDAVGTVRRTLVLGQPLIMSSFRRCKAASS